MNLDANNLYGCAMSMSMPTDGFKWVEVLDEIPGQIDPEGQVVEYPGSGSVVSRVAPR